MANSSPFPLLGEPLSLDLVNTRVRRDGAPFDLLATPAALAEWLRLESARLPWSGPVGATDLQAVQRLRADLSVLLAARREGTRPPAAALRRLNAALAAGPSARVAWPPAGPRLLRAGGGSRRGALLHALAADAAALLTGPSAALLRECAHPSCVLQFVAHHPRRTWCSAALCGNRARVARHFRRLQAAR